MNPAPQREFWSAFADGDVARMRLAAAEGADVNQPVGTSGGETPLIRAIAAGNLRLARTLLSLGAEVNRPGSEGARWTPLMFANDNPGLLRELLSNGASINARSSAHWTRCRSGRMVLRPGGETALHLAAATGNVEVVKALLEGGAEVEAKTDDGRTPLDYAISLGSITDVAELLVEAGAKLTPERLELMHSSAHNPDSDLLTFSVSADSRPEPRTETSRVRSLPPSAPQVAPSPRELRCPACNALIHSRKPRVCGLCGAPLPAELLATDQQAESLGEERGWDRFNVEAMASAKATSTAQATKPSVEAVLQTFLSTEETEHSTRPAPWVYVLAYTFVLFVAGFILGGWGALPPGTLLIIIGIFGLTCFFCYLRGKRNHARGQTGARDRQ